MRQRRCRPTPNTIETDSNLGVRFWTQELMVSRATLFGAIQVVGRDVSAVKEFLAREAATRRSRSEFTRKDDDLAEPDAEPPAEPGN